ncbi:MAG: CHAT domain-containing protein [Flavobacteriaceae bacterium]
MFLTQHLIDFFLKNKAKLVWLFTLIFINQVNSQTYFELYDSIIKLPKKNLVKLTDSLIEKAFSEKQYEISAKIAHVFSVENYKKKDYKKAIFYGKKEVFHLELANVKDKVYNTALYQLGLFYRYNIQYEQSIKVLSKVIDLNLDSQRVAQSYGSIGRCFYYMGDYSRGVNYFKKSIKLLEDLGDYRSLYTQFIGLINVYVRLGGESDLLKGLEVLKKMDALQSKISFSIKMKAGIYSLYAKVYNLLGPQSFSKAKYYYMMTISLNEKNNDTLALGTVFSDLADLYNRYKKDSAGYYALKSIPLVKVSSTYLTTSYINYIDYLINQNNYPKAFIEVKKALKINFKKDKEFNNYKKSELYNVTNKRRVLICLKQLTHILTNLYYENKDDKFLKNIIRVSSTYNSISLIIDEISNDDYAKFYWREKASNVYLYGSYASHLIGDSEAAFSFMEKNKALLLSESILKNTEFENLPKNVSDQETNFKKQIYKLENQLSKNESNAILQDSLFNTKRRHEDYVDSLKTVYPKYFDRKVDVEQVSLTQVQKELKEDEAVVSYIWNKFDEEKEILLGLVTTKSISKTFEVSNVDSLRTKIRSFQRLISKPFSTKEEQNAYQTLAFELYQELFPTEEIRSLLKGKDLTVIPDGDLQNIPFEALITKENSNQYLILDSNVSYAYSYSFLKHNEQVKRKTNQSFIGYSPVEFQDKELSSLNNSEKEVKTINKELSGVVKLYQEATKQNFLEESSKSQIIHLATHADAGENPWISFSGDKLALHELYTYKNNADLVTLSACNTSLGEVAKGEGVLSLARGFFYSGSKSVVSSLWEVNDSSTSEIMIEFYKNIKEGESKSEALNNAKRTYIKTHSLSEQSPYYWSSFVLIGDAGTIDFSNNNYLYLLIVIVLITGIFFFTKKRFF